MLATHTGIALSAEIERVLGAMRDEENSLLLTREKQSEAVSTATFLLLPVAVFLSLTILSLALFVLNAGVAERELLKRPPSDGGHRELLERRHHRQRPGQHRHQLESGS